MKLKDIIHISFQSAYRKKSSFLIVFLILVASISCLFSFSYKNSFEKYWADYINKSPDFRFLTVFYNEWLDSRIRSYDKNLSKEERVQLIDSVINNVTHKLMENEHILGASTQVNMFFNMKQIKNNFNDVSFSARGVPLLNNIPITLGENLDKYGENEKVMICPNEIYLSGTGNDFNADSKFNIEYLLNQTIDIEIPGGAFDKYKIVGFYNTLSTYSYGEVCYTSYDNVRQMTTSYYQANPKVLQQREEYLASPSYQGDSILIMIDNVSHVEEVQKFLKENKLLGDTMWMIIDTATVKNIVTICTYLTVGMLLFSVIILCLIFLQSFHKYKNQWLLYHSLGYSRSQILKLIFTENSILILFSYPFAIIISQIGLKLFQNLVLKFDSRLYLMNPTIDITSVFIGFIISLLIPILFTILISIFMKKKTFTQIED